MRQPITRRRFIAVTAAAAGLELMPSLSRAQASLVTWAGQSMGAIASLQVHHHDRQLAESLVRRALTEAARLERILSLYRADSTIVELNRRGVLLNPPAELVTLLEECRKLWALSGGAFDPTVQPIWDLYWRHFTRAVHDSNGPPSSVVQRTLDAVGFDKVAFDRERIVFARRGMAITLNGIAQGYMTDRIVDVLRAGGVERCFVDMGEGRAIGTQASGDPWQVRIARPEPSEPSLDVIELGNQAISTSSGDGFCFDPNGRFNHIFNPKDGRSIARYRTVTVVTDTATVADGLSTAFSLMSRADIDKIRQRLGQLRVRVAG